MIDQLLFVSIYNTKLHGLINITLITLYLKSHFHIITINVIIKKLNYLISKTKRFPAPLLYDIRINNVLY